MKKKGVIFLILLGFLVLFDKLIMPLYISQGSFKVVPDVTNMDYAVPRAYLAKFMLFPMICFGAHFLYFAPLPNIYPYFDIVLQIAGSLIFPVFYIYFRLLTVDNKFSLRVHADSTSKLKANRTI